MYNFKLQTTAMKISQKKIIYRVYFTSIHTVPVWSYPQLLWVS